MKKINFETQLQQTIPPQEILGASQRVSGLPIKTGITRLLKASLILRGTIAESSNNISLPQELLNGALLHGPPPSLIPVSPCLFGDAVCAAHMQR